MKCNLFSKICNYFEKRALYINYISQHVTEFSTWSNVNFNIYFDIANIKK